MASIWLVYSISDTASLAQEGIIRLHVYFEMVYEHVKKKNKTTNQPNSL